MAKPELLEGNVAIVTGAGRNIGRTTARLFAEEGAQVVVADIDSERATETTDLIRNEGRAAVSAVVDITDEEDVEEMVKVAEDTFGPVDVLVNSAAITARENFWNLSVESFEKVSAVNLIGTFLATRAAAKSMRDSNGGSIVNIASTSAHWGKSKALAYSTTKAGILNFTRAAAKALAPHEIRVNTLTPTRSGTRVGTDEQREGVPDDILLGRYGTPEDQAYAALFLVSHLSQFVTGVELPVDGGVLAGPGFDRTYAF